MHITAGVTHFTSHGGRGNDSTSTDGCSVGIDRGLVPTPCEDWSSADRSPACGGRYFVDFAIGSAVARFARGGIRPLGNNLWAVRFLEREWNVGRDSPTFAGPIDRCRCHRQQIVVHRWDHCPSPSLRWGRWEKKDPEEPADHALGRSRGGFSTKIHLLCDGKGHPLHFHLTPGQTHDSTALDTLLEGADANLHNGEGQPVAWPVKLGGDKGYRAEWIDAYLLDLGIQPVIPSKENEDRTDRPVKFDRRAYRKRNIVERLIGWLKESRRIFARFEKTAKNFGGFVKMAFIQRYLRLTAPD
jgi:transposase